MSQLWGQHISCTGTIDKLCQPETWSDGSDYEYSAFYEYIQTNSFYEQWFYEQIVFSCTQVQVSS